MESVNIVLEKNETVVSIFLELAKALKLIFHKSFHKKFTWI